MGLHHLKTVDAVGITFCKQHSFLNLLVLWQWTSQNWQSFHFSFYSFFTFTTSQVISLYIYSKKIYGMSNVT